MCKVLNPESGYIHPKPITDKRKEMYKKVLLQAIRQKSETVFDFCGVPICSKIHIFVERNDNQRKEFGLMCVPCKSWHCPLCARKKGWKYAALLQAQFERLDVRFMTLTLANVDNLQAAIRIASQAWNRLLVAIKRKFGEVNYARVLEFGAKNGRPHYHILIDKYISRKWLLRQAVKAGFGKVVDIRRAKNSAITKYITKYLTKSFNAEHLNPKIKNFRYRRVVVSRDINLENFKRKKWKGIKPIGSSPIRTVQELKDFKRKVQSHHLVKSHRTEGISVFIELKHPIVEAVSYTKIGWEGNEIPKGKDFSVIKDIYGDIQMEGQYVSEGTVKVPDPALSEIFHLLHKDYTQVKQWHEYIPLVKKPKPKPIWDNYSPIKSKYTGEFAVKI